MVNGNYVLYGDRPSSESEIVDDHVQTRTAERKNKRKSNRNANDLQRTLNMAQLDNDTDSVKYEKKVKEPKLLRYVPTSDVKENFVTEQFETYDLKPTEERPRRYTFQKKPRNPTDGSVNYAYSRSSSSCSSPNTNLPTISEHGEQYGTYRIQPIQNCSVDDIMSGYEKKMDKYFTKPKGLKNYTHKASYEGSHPDSLYRVQPSASSNMDKMARVLRMMRWPVALVIVCIALALFVYFLMPDNIDSGESSINSTQWNSAAARIQHGHGKNSHYGTTRKHHTHKNTDVTTPGTKTPEIDFYEADSGIKEDDDSITETNAHRVLPIKPVYPEHLSPEVQYGNEKADTDKLRTAKVLEEISTLPDESTLKPHITRKFEKPVVYFKDLNEAPTTETITRADIVNAFSNFGDKTTKNVGTSKSDADAYKQYYDVTQKLKQSVKKYNIRDNLGTLPDVYLNNDTPTVTEAIIRAETENGYANFENKQTTKMDYKEPEIRNKAPLDDVDLPEDGKDLYGNPSANFTSGHSNLFGLSIEDAEKMRSSTQSSLYNTRVSPTLPTWRDGDSTTINYPTNVNNYEAPQCRSTHLALCRGVLPYDLAGSPVIIDGSEATAYMKHFNYLVASNCSERTRQFVCALLEPECNPAPYPAKMPCYNLCKSISDTCYEHIPAELSSVFTCARYPRTECTGARGPCGAREAQCSDGTCIQRDWLCDGHHDCAAGEDEAQCSTCLGHEFRCASGGCILSRWLCDGYADCPRGEDEAGCAPTALRDPRDPEPGSEAAGSVSRIHRVPPPPLHPDESKELLMTSDTSSGLRRNFTRRPSKSRLAPYTRTTTTTPSPTDVTETFTDDDIMDDIRFFEDFTKKEDKKIIPLRKDRPRNMGKAPAPSDDGEATKLDKSINKLEKVLDGAALMKKAQAEEQAQEQPDSIESNSTVVDKNEEMISNVQTNDRYGGSAHRSPCPSGELRCVDGRCITLAQLCDGTIDCTDHADEDNCYT